MALNTTDTPELLQEQVSSLLIQPLETASIVLAAGPRIFDTASPLRIPKLVGSGTPAWVGESEQIPDDYTAEFDEVRLMPEGRKSVKVITRYSNELARQSVVGLDAVLRSRLVNDVSSMIDDAFLNGDGTNDSVTGIFNQPGTQTAPLDLTSADTFLDALAVTTAAEVTPNRWFLNAQDFITVRKLKDNNGRYLLESDLTRDATYRLFNIPVTVSNKVPAGKAVLADISQVAVARDTNPQIKILDQRYAEFDQQAIRVTARFDLGLLHPQGVVILDSAAGV
ncbi:phage major capsid protein [Nesterenkonia sp. E16_7]|uniref:phage major capsid protein n=1 Tax=unclassified Nesterenkonia TaxID=2629769 RepID=UPI001A910747|nr:MULTISPECIES: phage major capsid protein [unclassified Nesterenkonia]MBO0594500.1 phage major capsid protein [Nesterenkonia sp. E16_10]MBO0597292.1 phage major capsid protein [Nesterenkonia sp. E16_7]